jgi:hypothetical protein
VTHDWIEIPRSMLSEVRPEQRSFLSCLYLNASLEERDVDVDGKLHHLMPGQMVFSARDFATQAGISPASSVRYLHEFRASGLLKACVKQQRIIVTLLKFRVSGKLVKAAETHSQFVGSEGKPSEASRKNLSPLERREKEREESEAPKKRETWMTAFGNIWKHRYGGEMPFSQAARALKKLVDEHGEEKVAYAFDRYCLSVKAPYAHPVKFASTFGYWLSGHTDSRKPGSWIEAAGGA